MLFRILGAFCVLFLLVQAKENQTEPQVENAFLLEDKKVVCQVLTPSIPFANKGFNISNIDWNLCTHILVIDDILIPTEGVTEEQRKDDYKHLTDLRVKFPHLKISRSQNMHSSFEVYQGKNEKARTEFVYEIVKYHLDHSFDGIDMYWGDLSKSVNLPKDLLPQFFRELYDASHEITYDLLLTSTISMSVNFTERIDWSLFSNTMDYMHVMQFDAYPELKLATEQAYTEMMATNVQEKVNALIAGGLRTRNLVFGTVFGGPQFKTTFRGNRDEAKFNAWRDYGSICAQLDNPNTPKRMKRDIAWSHSESTIITKNYELKEDSTTQLKRLTTTDEKNDEVMVNVFGDSRTIANQIRFAINRKMGGVLTFPLNFDDFDGVCGQEYPFTDFNDGKHLVRNSTNFRLLKTVNEAIERTLDEIKKDLSTDGGSVTGGGSNGGSHTTRYIVGAIATIFILLIVIYVVVKRCF